MPKFRKKPVVIEAVQWHGQWSPDKTENPVCACAVLGTRFHVHTIHNNQAVAIELEDWIIPEPDGIHFYPCKPDIFETTYEAVSDAS